MVTLIHFKYLLFNVVCYSYYTFNSRIDSFLEPSVETTKSTTLVNNNNMSHIFFKFSLIDLECVHSHVLLRNVVYYVCMLQKICYVHIIFIIIIRCKLQ